MKINDYGIRIEAYVCWDTGNVPVCKGHFRWIPHEVVIKKMVIFHGYATLW